MRRLLLGLAAAAVAFLSAAGRTAGAADWPTHLGDNRRSAAAAAGLKPPLAEHWAHRAALAPEPAWPAPAQQDFYHGGQKLDARLDFDRAFGLAAAGEALCYGSSADGAVRCIDVRTGAVRWSFTTEGPVRLAPALSGGRVYFGSDDGAVYCLDAADGRQIWRHRPFDDDRRLPGNGRMISLRPVRSGVLVEDGRAYACAGIFPLQGVRLFCLDAAGGRELWKKDVRISAQGYLASDGRRLFVPTGRTGPAAFDLKDGRSLPGGFGEAAGDYLAVAPYGKLIFGRSRYLRALGVEGSKLAFPARFVAASGETAYLCGTAGLHALKLEGLAELADEFAGLERNERGKLVQAVKKAGSDAAAKAAAEEALRRLDARLAELKEQLAARLVWRADSGAAKRPAAGGPPYSFIRAGEVLFAGGDDVVRAFAAADGRELWSAKVEGRACELAAAGGRLFVSTDRGVIHCFGAGQGGAGAGGGQGSGQEVPGKPEAGAADGTAAAILRAVPVRRGWCLVLGAGDGRLAAALARTSEMQVVVAEPDARVAEEARRLAGRSGLGNRLAVHHIAGGQLPYPRWFANLVVVTPGPGVPAAELRRVLRPWGGATVAAGGASLPGGLAGLLKEETPGDVRTVEAPGVAGLVRQGGPAGAGEWTAAYADAGNTASSGDALDCTRLDPVWFGRPGPREIIDRHNRSMPPLVGCGRLFVPANERIIALDACNGATLWELEAPGSRRVGVMKDSGHMVLAGDRLYLAAGGSCSAIDAATGERRGSFSLPKPPGVDRADWGYLAAAGGLVFGTGTKPGASFGEHRNMCSILEGDCRPVIAAEYLFALDGADGSKKWLYQGGRLLDSAIAVDAGRIYFLECRGAAGAEKAPGRVRLDQVLAGETRLVALDAAKGTEAWAVPVRLPYQHIVYLSAARGTVLLSGSYNRGEGKTATVHYGLWAFDAVDGKLKWQREFATGLKTEGSHGEQWQHPVIAGGRVLTKYFACELVTGEPVQGWKIEGKGCGTLSASRDWLFMRGTNPFVLDIGSRKGRAVNEVSRPGCFLNIVPAGGLVLIPESSAGCTCGYPIQASFGYGPAK